MNTVIKGTKTIAEYKRVREDMENLARANYARHKEAFEEWGEGEPVKAWFDFEGNFCIEYESGKWWHYNDKILNGINSMNILQKLNECYQKPQKKIKMCF